MFLSAAVLTAMVLATEASLQLPPYLKPCARNDPNLDECTLRNGIAAIPSLMSGDRKYRIPVVNPLKITEIHIEDPNKGQTPTGLDIVMRDLTIYGLNGTQLKRAHFDLDKKQAEIEIQIPDLRMVMQYEIDGKILVLPIKGKGDGSINATDIGISYTLHYSLVTKDDGLEYMQAGESSLVHKTEHLTIRLNNLFNGDKTLGESTNTFLNENSDVVNQEIGPYIAQAIGEAIKQIIASCMDLIAYKDVFPEKL